MGNSTARTTDHRLKRNLVANLVGQCISASMAILFVPSYVKILGIEAYGLIGFYSLVQMFLTIFEMGVYPVLGRHMASFTAGQVDGQRLRDIFRTYLILVVAVGAALGLVIGSLAGFLSSEWFNLVELDENTVARAIMLIGVVVMLRFVEMVFRSALLGLQYQVQKALTPSTSESCSHGMEALVSVQQVWVPESME